MGFPEAVPETEAQQILAGISDLKASHEAQNNAINGLGANIQWIVDNVKGIFEMFGNPQMMQMMAGMAGGMMPPVPANLTGAESDNAGLGAATGAAEPAGAAEPGTSEG